jgi:hypothetical protein
MDNILFTFHTTSESFTIPRICHLYPHLQYSIVKHIDTEFSYFSRNDYTFCKPCGKEFRVRIEQRNRCFYIYFMHTDQTEFFLYSKMENYLSMMQTLDDLIELCLLGGEYSYQKNKRPALVFK